jgi:alpha-N-arabinofuranosidase
MPEVIPCAERPVDRAVERIVRVQSRFANSATISPLQYGQFIEYCCDLVPAMWAEKLSDGRFEGAGKMDYAFNAETDDAHRPWYPCGQVNCGGYQRGPADAPAGGGALRIESSGSSACTLGIAQDGLGFAAGERLIFSAWLGGSAAGGEAVVEVVSRSRLLSRARVAVNPVRGRVSALLVPAAESDNATLRILFTGPGSLSIDNCSLMPEDNIGGWRRDVVEAVRAMKPGIIRYGGGAVDSTVEILSSKGWDWSRSLGDPVRRMTMRAWGLQQPPGAGLEEIIQFIRAVGAEPMITVRVNDRLPSQAADQVEYFNGAASTRWGAMRAANGHAEPYGIRYWQIGNELSGTGYEDVLADFCSAMRQADPGIAIFASYPSQGVVEKAGNQLDFICPHHYSIQDLDATSRDILACRALVARAPRPIRLAVTEWNVTSGHFGLSRAMLWSLGGALSCARYRNLMHAHCDFVTVANRSNLVNSLCAGAIQTDQRGLYLTPTYHVDRLYATLAGDRVLCVDGSGSQDLDISATFRSAPQPMLTLFVVNAGPGACRLRVDVSELAPHGEARSWTLADSAGAGEPQAVNSFLEPERIAPVEGMSRCENGRIRQVLAAMSLTVLQVRVDSIPERTHEAQPGG